MINYKQLALLLLDEYKKDRYGTFEFYGNEMAIEFLLSNHYNIEDLIELGFEKDDINNVMQLLIDDYNTTK